MRAFDGLAVGSCLHYHACRVGLATNRIDISALRWHVSIFNDADEPHPAATCHGIRGRPGLLFGIAYTSTIRKKEVIGDRS